MTEIVRFYMDTPIDELRDKLEAKMNKGFLEHGPLKKTIAEVNHELENEYLDLIGWTLTRRYLERENDN